MATIENKRKLNTKAVKVKYNELKEELDGIPNSKVALKYGIPKNLIHVVENKERSLILWRKETTKKN